MAEDVDLKGFGDNAIDDDREMVLDSQLEITTASNNVVKVLNHLKVLPSELFDIEIWKISRRRGEVGF